MLGNVFIGFSSLEFVVLLFHFLSGHWTGSATCYFCDLCGAHLPKKEFGCSQLD